MTEGTPLRHTWEIPKEERDAWRAAQPEKPDAESVPISEESVVLKMQLDAKTVEVFLYPPDESEL